MPYKDKEKAKQCAKEYRLKNKEHIREVQKKYRLKHKEYFRQKHREWSLKNKERLEVHRKPYRKEYYLKNKKKIDRVNKEWVLKNPERYKKNYQQHYLKNKEKYKEKNRKYWLENKEKHSKLTKRWRLNNLERYTKKANEWKLKNREHILLRNKIKRHSVPKYRIMGNLRRRLNLALRGKSKSACTMELIGCTIEELWHHLEKQFKSGMTWDNYGKAGWEVDHIVPCANFDLSVPEQQKKCFHYTNLQPLWAFDNMSKGKKIISGDITSPKM